MSKVRVTPAMILGMLAEGKDRPAIAEELGLSMKDIKVMFQHPELKGKKVKKVHEPAFEWDTPEDNEEVSNSTEAVEEDVVVSESKNEPDSQEVEVKKEANPFWEA